MNPILFDFPSEFETERLRLRTPLPGDGEEINRAIRVSIDELRPWMRFAQTVPEIEDTESNIRGAHAAFITREKLRFHIYHREQGYFIGSSGFHNIDWEVPRFEIGYWIKTGEHGKGYMTEAVQGLTQFAFTQLEAKRVEIRCDVRNERSRKVAERSGYVLEGTLKNDSVGMDGTVTSTCVYAKTTDENDSQTGG